jgi:hypothetical protein
MERRRSRANDGSPRFRRRPLQDVRLVLDTGVLGQVCHPRKHHDVRSWFRRAVREHEFLISEVADYELRRELLDRFPEKPGAARRACARAPIPPSNDRHVACCRAHVGRSTSYRTRHRRWPRWRRAHRSPSDRGNRRSRHTQREALRRSRRCDVMVGRDVRRDLSDVNIAWQNFATTHPIPSDQARRVRTRTRANRPRYLQGHADS